MLREELGKKMLSEFLGFLKYKVDNDALTLEEEQAMLRIIEESIPVRATIEDIAGYYGKTDVAVRTVINRKLLNKPKRRVMYDFRAFSLIAPNNWKK